MALSFSKLNLEEVNVKTIPSNGEVPLSEMLTPITWECFKLQRIRKGFPPSLYS
jgi:hypothetical protein